jgi:leader peptidase (prepilin peptidase)/N-methyltransferase
MSAHIATAPALATRAARSALWWAGAALLCSLALLGLGAATGIEVRVALRAASLLLIAWAAAEDLRTRRLRNVLTAPAFVFALAASVATPGTPGDALPAVLGALLAPLPFLVIALPRPGAMGMGDVKLAAVAGALAGFGGLPLWWFGTALAGALLAVLALVRGGPRSTLAYGPALVAGLGAVLW